MRKLLRGLVVTGLLASAMTGVSGGAAHAYPAPPGTQTQTKMVTDPVCEEARVETDTAGKCQAEETITVSAGRPLTAAEVQQYGNLRAANGLTVKAAAAAGTVYMKTWWQEMHGLYYVNWKERHEGRWLYNGSAAWVNPRNGYNQGYHHCGLGYGIGYSVKVAYCNEYGEGTGTVENVDNFQVHVIAKGIPLYVTYSMTAYTRGNGGFSTK